LRRNIERVIIPYRRTASRGPNCDSGTIDKQLVSRISREMEERSAGLRSESQLATETDNPCGCVLAGRVNPVMDPDPVGLESIDRLFHD
jgi:hypothetical protein